MVVARIPLYDQGGFDAGHAGEVIDRHGVEHSIHLACRRKHVCGMMCRYDVESRRTRPSCDVASDRCNHLEPHAL
jgi:hypothetical protein